MKQNSVNSQLLDQPVDTTNDLRNKENTIMQLRKSVARFAALSAIVIAIAAAPAPASAQSTPIISGPSLLNSNRSSSIELRCAPPPADVYAVTLYLSDDINFPSSHTYWRTWNRPTNGWGTTSPFVPGTVNGSTSTQFWQGLARYYRPSGVYILRATTFNVYSAGPAGNLSSASFSPWSVLDRGRNGTQPTLTVTLDNPAQVGGQWVDVAMNSPYARFLVPGWNGFWIPQGQRSGSQSWFIGTNWVRNTNRIVNVDIWVNGTWGQTTFQVHK